MSRLMRLVLLVSLGLNVGLGWGAVRALRDEPRPPQAEGRSWRNRPATDDSVAWRRMMHRRVDRLATVLDLEPAQTARLEQLQAANAPTVRARRERIEAARRALREQSAAATFDPAATRTALAAVRHAQADLDSLTQEFLLQEFDVLTPAQRARYVELLPMEPWRSGRSGPGGGDGPAGLDERRGKRDRDGNRRHREE
jgi:Spy/CpxP family protein refolding chaperone